jgi:signal transduction histidine kinase
LLPDTLAKQYDTYRYVGFSFVAIALVTFVLTVVAFIAKLNIADFLWMIAFWVFFTGGVYILDVPDVFYWNENLPANTAMLALCQILSSFFLSLFVTNCLTGKNKKIGIIAQTAVGGITLITILLSAFDIVRIFDVRCHWYLVYAIQGVLLSVLGIRELSQASKGIRVVLISSLISMLCVLVEFFAGALAIGGALSLSKLVFGAMLIIVMAFGIHAIISNYKISMRTKEMETELKDKSIAVMISQIQPHFLYNSLNTIAELCVVDPKRAEKATIDFSRYLRGNMGALNEKKPIEFEDELSHLNHYIELEKLRYGNDLQFEYDIKDVSFTLPALTVQPLVENAVNHGIRYHKMKGKVKISSYSDEDNYYVAIEDDGVGFDPEAPMEDGRKHVGIANVKYRLEVVCGGSLDIKSVKGQGSVVTIRIPKEKQL